MSGSDDVVAEYEIDDVLKDDTGEDLKGDADNIICTVTFQSSSTEWHRSLIIPN
jgi:hypothetical protein